MDSGNTRAPGPAAPALAALVTAFWNGSVGWTVRCTPRRRTLMAIGPDGAPAFGKLRTGSSRVARAEWRWLHALRQRGFRTAEPLALRCQRGRSLVCTAVAAGRPMDALLCEARAAGQWNAFRRYACEVVAPLVRRLHDQGLCFRDLYWNHLFAESLAPGAPAPTWIDVERTFRPRWRRRRWQVKDLAGLWSSAAGAASVADGARFLRAYLGPSAGDWRGLARAVARKARRIAAHRPRYG